MARVLHTALLLSAVVAATLGCFTPEYGPCTCKDRVVECRGVTDGTEVQDAMVHFGPLLFASVSIEDSPDMTSLPAAAFGAATFKELRFFNTGLERLEPSVVADMPCALTIELLYIKRCPSFDYLDTELVLTLTSLTQLYVSSNGIPALTGSLSSSSLAYLDLSDNGITEIAVDYFKGCPALREVLLSFNQLSTEALTQEQAFSSEAPLYLNLGYNSLSEGIAGLQFTDAVPKQLILSGNGITLFSEESYSPLIASLSSAHQGAYLLIDDNPLECGCDMAWLPSNPNRDIVTGGVCQQSGRLVANLQEADFAHC